MWLFILSDGGSSTVLDYQFTSGLCSAHPESRKSPDPIPKLGFIFLLSPIGLRGGGDDHLAD